MTSPSAHRRIVHPENRFLRLRTMRQERRAQLDEHQFFSLPVAAIGRRGFGRGALPGGNPVKMSSRGERSSRFFPPHPDRAAP